MEHHRRKTPIPDNILCRITKLFVSNLPEGCSGNDLAIQVRPFGHIYDLYIARKRDKSGNRFGFISMLDVKDKTELLASLRGIRMGESKLWFNIARFVLEEGEIGDHHKNFRHYNDNNISAKESERQTNNMNNDNKQSHNIESEGVQGHNFVPGGRKDGS